jgi:predicted SAM-dependent methyltransferase
MSTSLRRALRQVQLEVQLNRRHRASLKRARSLRGPLKLHLGSGRQRKEGWVNIDLLEPDADLQLDVREAWPFPDGSVTSIYSEHFFEHLEFPEEAQHVLREAYRVLRPGGRFSVGVPDLGPVLGAYARRDVEAFSRSWDPNYPEWLRVPMHRINHMFRQFGEHRYAYDEEILTQVLRETGFRAVKRRDYDSDLDVVKREGTLYVDGLK